MASIEMSVRFRFAETQAYTIRNDDESTWRAEPLGESHKPIEDKWVYVFQARSRGAPPSPGAPTTLHRACFCDRSQNRADTNEKLIHVLTGDRAKRDAALDLDNGRSVTAVEAVSLEDVVNGEQCYYYFFASSIQLGSDMLLRLEGNISKYVPAVNLPDVDTSVPSGVRRDVFDVPVVDPITIAMTFHALYLKAADRVVVFSIDVQDAKPEERRAARARGSKLFLARYTKAILDADTDDKLVSKSTKSAALARIHAFLGDDGKTERALFEERERHAIVLTRWLCGNLFQIVESAHRERERFVYQQYVRVMAAVTHRLIEAAAGKALLAQFGQTHTHLVDEYLVRKTTWPTEWQFGTYKKCAGAGLSLLKDLLLVRYAESYKTNPKIADEVVDLFNRLAGKTVLKVERLGEGTIQLRKTGVARFQSRLLERVIRVEGATVPFDSWVKEQKGHVSVLNFALDMLNTCLNLIKFIDAVGKPDRETFFAGLKAAGSAANVVKAFGGIFDARWTKNHAVLSVRLRGTAGILGALIDAVFAVKDGHAAYRREDGWAVYGNLLLFGGSTLTAFGALFTLIGESALAGPVTFIGAAVAMLGAVLVELFTDTDIETFVKFCSFGDLNVDLKRARNQQPQSDRPSFSATDVIEWDGSAVGLKKQLDALYAIAGGFSFRAVGPLPRQVPFALKLGTTIEIDLGDVPLGARVHLSYTCAFDRRTLEPKLLIDPLADLPHSVQVLSTGDPAEVNFTRFERGGRIVYQIEIDWPNHTVPSTTNQSMMEPELADTWVEAHFDVFGDGTTVLPPRGALRGQTYRKPKPFFDHVFRSAAA